MGKKRTRKTYISKGQRPNVNKDFLKQIAREVGGFDQEMNLRKAWRAGTNPWITVKNPQSGTNRPYYKVRANEYWGHPKKVRNFNIYIGKEKEAA